MPHLSSKEIQRRLREKWSYGISEHERQSYLEVANENKQSYYARYEEVQDRISEL